MGRAATDKPWRFSWEFRDSVEAPIPTGDELEDDEFEYAGLPQGPRIEVLPRKPDSDVSYIFDVC